MNKENLKYIPAMFQKVEEFSSEQIDTRFLKVKIWLMHLGLNLNGSYFSKEAVQQAIPSLQNTPILCFIEQKEDGEKDFSDHRMVLVREDGEFKFKYLGSAIGTIPENNNAHFEERLCDDGVTREFLVVDGLIWTKWDDPIDIFNKNSIKPQSMELHDSYEGEFDNGGVFHFTNFSFFGACILGDDVVPAMKNSTVEIQQFSSNSIFEEINSKVELYKNNFTQINERGGNVVKREEIIAKFNYLSGNEYEEVINNTDFTDEELENKLFALSVGQMRQAINTELDSIKGYYQYWDGEIEEINKYYLYDIIPSQNIAVVEDNTKWNIYYGIPYVMAGDKCNLDEENKKRYVRGDWREMVGEEPVINPIYSQVTEKFAKKVQEQVSLKEQEVRNSFNVKETEEYKTLEANFTTKENELAELNEKIEQYTANISELTEFKEKQIEVKRKSDTDLAISKFALEDEDVKELKIEAYEGKITLDVLEEKLYALVGKKNFALNSLNNKGNDGVKYTLKNEDSCPYDGLEEFFEK